MLDWLHTVDSPYLLMPCHSHRQLVSIQLCSALPSPYSSSYLKRSFLSSRLYVFFGRPLPLWLCAVHCSACLAMLSPLFLSVWPSHFHFLLSWTNTSSWSVFFHSSLLDILSGQWMSKILLRHLFTKTCSLSIVFCVTVTVDSSRVIISTVAWCWQYIWETDKDVWNWRAGH